MNAEAGAYAGVRSIHVLGSQELSGAEQFFIRLVNALAQAGHPTLAVTRRSSPVSALLSNRVEQCHLPLASKWDVWSRWRINHLVHAWQPDVVQTYMGRASRLTHLPASCEAVHVARLGGYYKVAGYYGHADAWVGNTRDICAYLEKEGLPAERIFHIGNFVPAPRPVAPEEIADRWNKLGLPAQARIIFALGRLIEKKGFQDLLDAFARLPAQHDHHPLVLLVAGDGTQRAALGRQAAALGIAARVFWLGWQEDPQPFYAMADAFVCPSRHEPLGNVILEAWTHRVPVLSTCNEGASQLIMPGRNGLLAPIANPVALADGMLRLLSLPPRQRQAMIEAGHATAADEHGEQAVVHAYLGLYRRLSRKGSASRPGGRLRFVPGLPG